MRSNGWSKLIAITLGVLPAAAAFPGLVRPANAETGATKLAVRVSPVILAEPEIETTLSIQVGPEASIPRQTFLRIRGLPLSAKLSEGHVVSPGVWAVPLSALGSLRLSAPLASSGRTELNLSLVSVDGGVLAEARSSLVVAPAWLLGSAGPRPDTTRSIAPRRPETPPTTATATAVSTPDVGNARPATPVSPPPPAAGAVQASAAAPTPLIKEPAVAPTTPRQATVVPSSPPPPAPLPPPVAAAEPVQPAAQSPAQPPAPAQLLAAPAPPPTLPARVAALPPASAPAAKTPSPLAVSPAALPPPAKAAPAAKVAPVLSAADRARAEALVQRGETFLVQGNVAAARQFFRRAADLGLAQAALKLGSTYDPVELASMTVVGLQPDPKEARTWYELARELGASEAGARLSRLQGR